MDTSDLNPVKDLTVRRTKEVVTVGGAMLPEALGRVDAHAYLWIERVDGAGSGAPVLDDHRASLEELESFRRAGGGALVDCQPPGCGRNGRVLAELWRETGVVLVACTGFHLSRYYPPGSPVWSWTAGQAAAVFIDELQQGMSETRHLPDRVRAGCIKTACEASLAASPWPLLEAAAEAGRQTGSAIQVHTEKGQDAEKILEFFVGRGVPAERLVLCHMDKRPDFGLHSELARAGALLEYDTFFRPKYDPEHTLWPLLEQMVAGGWARSLALATDLADARDWRVHGGRYGLSGLLTHLLPRLRQMGLPERIIPHLLGENIAQRLAR